MVLLRLYVLGLNRCDLVSLGLLGDLLLPGVVVSAAESLVGWFVLVPDLNVRLGSMFERGVVNRIGIDRGSPGICRRTCVSILSQGDAGNSQKHQAAREYHIR